MYFLGTLHISKLIKTCVSDKYQIQDNGQHWESGRVKGARGVISRKFKGLSLEFVMLYSLF